MNVRYACDAVKACASLGCKRFIFASSIMEYEILAVMEKEITPGLNTLYSSAKLAADLMARAVAGNLGVGYISAVISNIFGPADKYESAKDVGGRTLFFFGRRTVI